MRTIDRRFHSADESLDIQAAQLLEKLSERAWMEPHAGSFGDNVRHQQRNRERFPDSHGNQPGAFIERWCSPEQRELLRQLKSDPDAPLPSFYRWIFREGHPDNKVGGVLEWSAPTIWSFT